MSRIEKIVLAAAAFIALAVSESYAAAPAPIDCNHNGIPDSCDVASASACPTNCTSNNFACGRSGDCNMNAIPDECDIDISQSLGSDSCAGAEPIAPGYIYSGTTAGMSPNGATSHCGGSNGSGNVFYIYRPVNSGTLVASTCGSSFDTVLAVHKVCPTSSSSEIACNNDDPAGVPIAGCSPQSVLTMPVMAGKRYLLSIMGRTSHADGSFLLQITGPDSKRTNDCDRSGVPDSCKPDSDGDSVPNVCDNCPNVSNWDQADSDGDGIGDACEKCPAFDDKLDTDHDGIPNGCDQCPFDAAKTSPGVCGCGVSDVDANQNRIIDCIESDQCPSDPSKTDPGVCGCGVPDSDTNGNGIPDCLENILDLCPDDPNKAVPGVCGCGEPDLDANNDGIMDCLETTETDLCSNDPNKTVPGVCGCGVTDSDTNSNGITDCLETTNQNCPIGQECVFESLLPTACTGANGFLKQINIASVINLLAKPLRATVTYTRLDGTIKGTVTATIPANLKQDFIINDLGLEKDSYGTVCVSTDATVAGAWTGGITLYKPNEQISGWTFGQDFDFALYEPFSNARTGQDTQPLNTFHLGVSPNSTVANWVSITDGTPEDGYPLTGQLIFFDAEGKTANTTAVNIPNAGRFDFSGHEGIGGQDNKDAIGMVRFIPDKLPNGNAAKYYFFVVRYFYNCVGASCTNFHTAFAIPRRPAASVALSGGVSTSDNAISVVELNNTIGQNELTSSVHVYGDAGAAMAQEQISIPPLGTRHYIVNKTSTAGALAANTVGSAVVDCAGGNEVSALTMFYKLDKNGVLAYGYSAPLVQSPGTGQISEFNSFIQHQNYTEVFNPGAARATVQLQALDYTNTQVYQQDLSLEPKETQRILLPLSADTYGTLIVQSTIGPNVVVRNLVIRPDKYVLPFGGH